MRPGIVRIRPATCACEGPRPPTGQRSSAARRSGLPFPAGASCLPGAPTLACWPVTPRQGLREIRSLSWSASSKAITRPWMSSYAWAQRCCGEQRVAPVYDLVGSERRRVTLLVSGGVSDLGSPSLPSIARGAAERDGLGLDRRADHGADLGPDHGPDGGDVHG